MIVVVVIALVLVVILGVVVAVVGVVVVKHLSPARTHPLACFL
jgi:hypothetical protein